MKASPLPLWERAFCRDLARAKPCASRTAERVRGEGEQRPPHPARPSTRATLSREGRGEMCCGRVRASEQLQSRRERQAAGEGLHLLLQYPLDLGLGVGMGGDDEILQDLDFVGLEE